MKLPWHQEARDLTENEQKVAAKAFAKNWRSKGYEKGETQPFWLALLQP